MTFPLAALLAGLLAPPAGIARAAAPPPCARPGESLRLLGDPFVLAECSAAPRPAEPLPAEPAASPAKPGWSALEGAWEGLLVHGMGRYAVRLEARARWGGRAELLLRWKERQLKDEAALLLALAPARGGHAATISLPGAPGLALGGRAAFLAGPDGSRRAELSFENGAAHRLLWSFPEKDLLRFSAVWSVPGAPLQRLEGDLRRAP